MGVEGGEFAALAGEVAEQTVECHAQAGGFVAAMRNRDVAIVSAGEQALGRIGNDRNAPRQPAGDDEAAGGADQPEGENGGEDSPLHHVRAFLRLVGGLDDLYTPTHACQRRTGGGPGPGSHEVLAGWLRPAKPVGWPDAHDSRLVDQHPRFAGGIVEFGMQVAREGVRPTPVQTGHECPDLDARRSVDLGSERDEATFEIWCGGRG